MPVAGQEPGRLGGRPGDAGDLEARRPGRRTPRAPRRRAPRPRRRAPARSCRRRHRGRSVTVNSAPPSGGRGRCRRRRRGGARPGRPARARRPGPGRRPRPWWSSRARARGRACSAVSPGPLSPTTDADRVGIAAEPDRDPSVRPPGHGVEGVVDEVAEHGDQVARGHGVAEVGQRRPRWRARCPRSAASAVLPSSSAATTGSPTAPTTRSVRRWATSSSSVAKSTASSGRPISISDTTVCSRLAASWVCERSDSVRPRTTSSSPVTDRSSVWSRRRDHGADVAALPGGGRRADHQHALAGDVDVVGLGGPARARPPTSPGGRPRSSSGRPTTSSGRSSSRRASSLTSCTRPRSSSSSSPSRTACRTARVVLVHPGDLALAHAVGLAAQPAADQPGAGQPDRRAPPPPATQDQQPGRGGAAGRSARR